jgi:hypothetical protein
LTILETEGYRADMRLGVNGTNWTVLAMSQSATPEPESFEHRMSDLAKSLGGEFLSRRRLKSFTLLGDPDSG